MNKIFKQLSLIPIGIVTVSSVVSCTSDEEKNKKVVDKVDSAFENYLGESDDMYGGLPSSKTLSELRAVQVTTNTPVEADFHDFLTNTLGISINGSIPNLEGCKVVYNFIVDGQPFPKLWIRISKDSDNYEYTQRNIIDFERRSKIEVENIANKIQKSLVAKRYNEVWESDKEFLASAKNNAEMPATTQSWNEAPINFFTSILGIELVKELPTDWLGTYLFYKFDNKSSTFTGGHRVDIKVQKGESLSEFWFFVLDNQQQESERQTISTLKSQVMSSVKNGWTDASLKETVESTWRNRVIPDSSKNNSFSASTLPNNFGVGLVSAFPVNLFGITLTYDFVKQDANAADSGSKFTVKFNAKLIKDEIVFYIRDEDQQYATDAWYAAEEIQKAVGGTLLGSNHTNSTMPSSRDFIWSQFDESIMVDWLATPIVSSFPTDLRGAKLQYKFTKNTEANKASLLVVRATKERLLGPSYYKDIEIWILTVEQIVPSVSKSVKQSIKSGWTGSSTVINSSKSNSELPTSNTSPTQFTTEVLQNIFGVDKTLPTQLMGANLTYTFVKNSSTNKSGNELVITCQKGTITEIFTIYLLDTNQAS